MQGKANRTGRLVGCENFAATTGTVIGTLTLAALGVYSWLFVRSMLAHWTLKHFIVLLFRWQTLTGAVFAIAAAVIGATAILHQTETTRQREEKRRERRAAALRAVLPLALTELSDYAARCATICAEWLVQSRAQGGSALAFQFPALPTGLVDTLIELIEAIESDHARPLVVLLRRLQIQHARARDIQQRVTGQHGKILLRNNVVGGVIDAAEIHARCSKLFAYARGCATVPAAAISSNDVKQALFLMLPCLGDAEELGQKIDHRATADWPEN